MNLTIPAQIVEQSGATEEEILIDLAVGLFSGDHLTLGRAAEFAGMSKSSFLDELGKRRIPVHYDLNDLESDLDFVRGISTPES